MSDKKYVSKWNFGMKGKDEPMTVREHIESKIHRAPDYYAGELESMSSRLAMLVDIVCMIAESLSDKAEKRLAEKLDIQEESDED